MDRQELRRLIKGLIVVTCTPFDDGYELDLGRMAEITEFFVESGLVEGRAVLKVVSIMGELPSMTDEEWPHVVRATVRAANGRVPGNRRVPRQGHEADDRRRAEGPGPRGRRAADISAPGEPAYTGRHAPLLRGHIRRHRHRHHDLPHPLLQLRAHRGRRPSRRWRTSSTSWQSSGAAPTTCRTRRCRS